MASSGLHSNGYSLVRHVFSPTAGWSLDRDVAELGRTLGEELLVPTRIYSRDCLALIDGVEVHAMSHVTGGGLANNLARVVPDTLHGADRPRHLGARRRSSVWSRELGRVPQADLEATLNLGVGMVALVPPDGRRRRAARCWPTAACRPGSAGGRRPRGVRAPASRVDAWTVEHPASLKRYDSAATFGRPVSRVAIASDAPLGSLCPTTFIN